MKTEGKEEKEEIKKDFLSCNLLSNFYIFVKFSMSLKFRKICRITRRKRTRGKRRKWR